MYEGGSAFDAIQLTEKKAIKRPKNVAPGLIKAVNE